MGGTSFGLRPMNDRRRAPRHHRPPHDFGPDPAVKSNHQRPRVTRPFHLPEIAVATAQTDSRTPDLQPLLLRMSSVVRLTGLGRSTIYRLMATREFPRPVRLSARAVAWRREELDRWSEARVRATH